MWLVLHFKWSLCHSASAQTATSTRSFGAPTMTRGGGSPGAARTRRPRTYVIPQHYFACDGETLTPTLSAEHTEWRWADEREAMQILRYDGNRTALFELAERLRRDDLPEPG